MVLILWALLACGGAPPANGHDAPGAEQSAGKRQDADAAALAKALEGGAPLLDVRTPREFQQGHVEGAVNLPMGFSLDDPTLQGLDKSKPVYVICAVGGRSSAAADQLAAAGYQAVNVRGGTRAWVGAGRPVVK